MPSLRPSTRSEVRRNRYKLSVDAGESRRRRQDDVVSIRKNRREESLQKNRHKGLHSHQLQLLHASTQSAAINDKLERLPALLHGVWCSEKSLQLEATTQLRILLSLEHRPLVKEVVQSGVVSRFVEFITSEDFPQLQFEAALALTSIASETSENTKVVIDEGAVPVFVKLLASPCDCIREQAVIALGYIAGDSPRCRDHVLGYGAMLPLLAQLNEQAKPSMLRNATWALSNFCRGKPQTCFDQVKPAIPFLACLIHSNDEEVLANACWTLCYLSDVKVQDVIEANVFPQLVKLLIHPSPSVLVPALRTIGNLVAGEAMQTQCIIHHQLLPRLLGLVTNNHQKSLRKEVVLILSNIMAGSEEQIQAVIDGNIIDTLILVLQKAEFHVKKEVAKAIRNATFGGSHEQVMFMVSRGCIKPLCDLLASSDPTTVMVCLEGLENILMVGELEKHYCNSDVNLYAQMIEDAEGLEKIDQLQSHGNGQIYDKAVDIFDRYCLEEY